MLGVALLAEGVDIHSLAAKKKIRPRRSPSSRRAWIEIPPTAKSQMGRWVALLAEGVDRNLAFFTPPV